MKVDHLADFLETDRINFTFSPLGLVYLALRGNRGARQINLRSPGREGDPDPEAALVLKETERFLEKGVHDLPLDLGSLTPFQQSVFQVIAGIEPGRLMTYKDVAVALGKPGAARAVGSAVTKNPVSYFLPTHRVLPQRGIGICRTGAGYLREKLLVLEGHDLSRLKGNYLCTRKKCCLE